MKRSFYLSIIFLILVLPSIGFGEDEILVGLIPEENIFRQMDRYRPLASYLSKKINANVRLTILSRYGDIIDRFISRRMDGAFFGVFTSVLAMEKLGVEPLVRPVNIDGSSTSQAYVFARKDSGIKDIKDMRGKRMAFVDRATATGYLYFLALLKDGGFSGPDSFFREYYFTGSHEAAVYAVMDNRADLGIAKAKIFNKLIEKDSLLRNELIVLYKSPDFPDTTLCLKKELPEITKRKIKDALLNMDKDSEGVTVLKKFGAIKFIPAEKKDFKQFLYIVKKAGIDIRNYRYR